MIINYIICSFILNSLLVLWFKSPFKNTLGKFLFKKDLTSDQFDDRVFLKNKILGKLTSCWVCCSYWLSLLIGIVWVILFAYPYYWPFLLFFTLPFISYLFYSHIK